MNFRITGGRIVDPGRYEGPGDILVVDGKIAASAGASRGRLRRRVPHRPIGLLTLPVKL